MYIGTHISIRRGYLAAARTARALGMKAYQFFSKNPRMLSVKSYDPADAEACRQFVEEHGIKSVIHAPYTVNLATEDEQLRQLTIQSIQNDLDICDACGAIGLVVHIGKVKGDVIRTYQRIIGTLNEILIYWQGKAFILLENEAGEGGGMATTLEEITQIRRLTDVPGKIGFCLDTCHAYASGLWNGSNTGSLIARGTELEYWDHLKVVHLNDSVYPSGQRRDRHAPLDRGRIGLETMQDFVVKLPSFRELPFILETPEEKDWSHTQQIASFLRLIR